jgi:hypothetical protein
MTPAQPVARYAAGHLNVREHMQPVQRVESHRPLFEPAYSLLPIMLVTASRLREALAMGAGLYIRSGSSSALSEFGATGHQEADPSRRREASRGQSASDKTALDPWLHGHLRADAVGLTTRVPASTPRNETWLVRRGAQTRTSHALLPRCNRMLNVRS